MKTKKKIGILGGTFDPAHKGHLEISKQAKKRFKLEKVVWAITRQNPLKTKSKSNLKDRIQFAKKFVSKNFNHNKMCNLTLSLYKQAIAEYRINS